jgi:spore coat polysaccharide biosynthesis protein SpsF (cytidylyltransferase family)
MSINYGLQQMMNNVIEYRTWALSKDPNFFNLSEDEQAKKEARFLLEDTKKDFDQRNAETIRMRNNPSALPREEIERLLEEDYENGNEVVSICGWV